MHEIAFKYFHIEWLVMNGCSSEAEFLNENTSLLQNLWVFLMVTAVELVVQRPSDISHVNCFLSHVIFYLWAHSSCLQVVCLVDNGFSNNIMYFATLSRFMKIEVCSPSCPLASWISPLFSREYSCGPHGNMLRLHGNMLEYSRNSLEIFLTQRLLGYDRKWLEWNYLWQQLISYLSGIACMINCIVVIIFCQFVDRFVFLSWCGLCIKLDSIL